MLPYLGWAQDTHQTAPSCLLYGRVSRLRHTLPSVGRMTRHRSVPNSPLERLSQPLGFALDFEDLDCAV